MRIVPMNHEHIAEVAHIEQMCFSDPWSQRMLEEELYNDVAAFLVAEDDNGKVMGYAGLHVMADEGYVANIAVHPSYRRQGIATALLDVYLRFAESHSLAFLTPEVRRNNQAAIALYKKMGFLLAGVRKHYYQHPVEDAIIMTKELIPGTAVFDPKVVQEGI